MHCTLLPNIALIMIPYCLVKFIVLKMIDVFMISNAAVLPLNLQFDSVFGISIQCYLNQSWVSVLKTNYTVNVK